MTLEQVDGRTVVGADAAMSFLEGGGEESQQESTTAADANEEI